MTNIQKKEKLLKLFSIAILVLSALFIAVFASACGNKTHKITLDTQGGILYTLEYENTVESEPRPTKDGYFFRGWYLNADCSGEKVSFPYEANNDVVLYAKWEVDSRTPLEKFVADGGEYTTKIDKQYCYFVYNASTRTVNVKCSFDSGLVTFFKFEYNYQMGNLANSSGTIKGTDGSSYSVEINQLSSNRVYLSCKHTGGTDWTSPDVVGLESKFIDKIPTAFSDFYDYCFDNYGLKAF